MQNSLDRHFVVQKKVGSSVAITGEKISRVSKYLAMTSVAVSMPDILLYFTNVPEPPTPKKEIGEIGKECILSWVARSLNSFVFFQIRERHCITGCHFFKFTFIYQWCVAYIILANVLIVGFLIVSITDTLLIFARPLL